MHRPAPAQFPDRGSSWGVPPGRVESTTAGTQRASRCRRSSTSDSTDDGSVACPAYDVAAHRGGRASSRHSMTSEFDSQTERELNVHIFSVSAQLVGLCLTVIGLFRIIAQLKPIDSIADNVLSVDAMLFLAACMFAYASLRSRTTHRRRRLERIADAYFGTALVVMTAVCMLIAWTL